MYCYLEFKLCYLKEKRQPNEVYAFIMCLLRGKVMRLRYLSSRYRCHRKDKNCDLIFHRWDVRFSPAERIIIFSDQHQNRAFDKG